MPPVDLGMTSGMAAYYRDQNLTLYEVQTPVALPVRKPTDDERSKLGAAPKGTPYPRAPFLLAGDESVEVHYTITNADPADHAVWLLVDPWNEFVRWNPGVTIVDDETTEPNWGYDLAFVVPARSRIEGTLTPDDMHEIAIKLASVENELASPQAKQGKQGNSAGTTGFDPTATANNIFNPQNRSNGGDPLYTPWIPPVIAGLTGFDLGLRTQATADGAGGGANVAVEIVVHVQDLRGDRFVTAGSSAAQLGPPPATLSPPGAIR